MKLSVVVPIYNEEYTLPTFLHHAQAWQDDCELVFVDGGSADKSLELLQNYRVIAGPHGRGQQLAAGIAATSGDALLVLHADSVLTRTAFEHVCAALDQGVAWGCLTLRFAPPSAGFCATHPAQASLRQLQFAFGAALSNARVRTWGIAFGDQAMFFQREVLERSGGMPELSLMEDYELSRRLRKLCRPRQLKATIQSSSRRFERSPLRRCAQMFWLRARYRAGASPEELAASYRKAGR